MATVPKRPLTQEEKDDAKRLKSAWESFQSKNKGSTQDWLGEVTGLGGQSVIGQYLNGNIQLNHKALLSICKVIGADPAKISPGLAAKIPTTATEIVGDASRGAELIYVDLDEIRILTLYRESTPTGKSFILDAALSAEKTARR